MKEAIASLIAILIPIGMMVYTIFFGYPTLVWGFILLIIEMALIWGGELNV